jgi:hypothetical protein
MKCREFIKKGVTGIIGLSGMTTLLNACSKTTNGSVKEENEDDDKVSILVPIPAGYL